METSIIREFPTDMKYRKDSQGRLIAISDGSRGRHGHIDVVISYKSKYRIGYEIFFGKETPNKEMNMNDDRYFFKRSNVSLSQLLTHTKNDIEKLKNQNNLDYSYVLIFVATLHENGTTRDKFTRKRKRIIEELKKLQPLLTEKVKICYFEKGFVSVTKNNDFTNGEPSYLCSISNQGFYENRDCGEEGQII